MEAKEIRMLSTHLPEIRQAEGEPTKIVGYAVMWDQLSQPIWGMFQERFQKGAFSRTLMNSPDVYASWQHDVRDTLGRTPNTLTVVEDDIGLRYEITPPSWAEKYIESIQRGDVRGSSFIFRAVKEEWDESNPDMPIRTVIDADLMEVSPVTTPAYPQSSVGVRSAEDVLKTYQEMRAKSSQNDENKQKLLDIRKKKLDLLSKC